MAGKSRYFRPKILLYITVIFFVVLAILPLVWMISASLKPNVEMLSYPVTFFPKKVTSESYKSLLFEPTTLGPSYWVWYLNSVIVSVVVTLIGISLACSTGYALSRFRFIGRKFYFYGVIIIQMLPAPVLVIPLYVLLHNIALLDTLSGLIMVYITFVLPLSIWIIKGFFDSIPFEMEEAALIDGCTQGKAFLKIALPLAAPGIAATAVYAFILCWSEFLFAQTFLSSYEKYTFPIGLTAFQQEFTVRWNGVMAGAFMASVPALVLFMFLEKYFVVGMTRGGVKG